MTYTFIQMLCCTMYIALAISMFPRVEDHAHVVIDSYLLELHYYLLSLNILISHRYIHSHNVDVSIIICAYVLTT